MNTNIICPGCDVERPCILSNKFDISRNAYVTYRDSEGRFHMHNPNKQFSWAVCRRGHRFTVAHSPDNRCKVVGCDKTIIDRPPEPDIPEKAIKTRLVKVDGVWRKRQ